MENIIKQRNKVTMKEKIKKLFTFICGTEDNIFFKLTLSFLTISIIFFLFMIKAPRDSIELTFFTIAFDFSFALWLIMAKGADSASKFATELAKLIIFLGFFLFSIYFFYFFSFYRGFRLAIFAFLACMGLFISVLYFISSFITIFKFIKNVFFQFKNKLFDSAHSVEQKTKSLTSFILNISAFLAAIGGLTLAIKGIIEPLINIFNDYFIK